MSKREDIDEIKTKLEEMANPDYVSLVRMAYSYFKEEQEKEAAIDDMYEALSHSVGFHWDFIDHEDGVSSWMLTPYY